MNKAIKKTLIWIGILILILLIIFSLLKLNITGSIITGSPIQASTYTVTKAICDESNYCEDYKIQCQGEKIISINPTGFAVQNSDSWKDPRTPKEINNLCN